jgi:hypothetical protein
MIDKIGFEVLPNVYFRDIFVTKVVTHSDNVNKRIFKRLEFKVKLICYDDIVTKTWSKNDSTIMPLMQIKLNVLFGDDIQEEYVIPISANKEIEHQFMLSESTMKLYSNYRKEDNILLECCVFLDSNKLKSYYAIDINEEIRGPKSSEIIINGKEHKHVTPQKTYIYVYEDGRPVYGPYHQHIAPPEVTQEVVMQGSFHRNKAHKKIFRKEIASAQKISYNVKHEPIFNINLNDPKPIGNLPYDFNFKGDNIPLLSEEILNRLKPTLISNFSQNDKKSKFNISFSKNIMGLQNKNCKTLYKTNPELFLSLQNKISVKSMTVLRAEINSQVIRNRCNVIIGETEQELKYEKVSYIVFKDNNVDETITFRTNDGRLRYIDKKSIKKLEDNNYKTNDFTTRGLRDSKVICSVKKSSVQMEDVETLDFVDNSLDETSNTKYKYSIEYEVETKLDSIIAETVNNLRKQVSEINGILRRVERKKHFNFRTNRFTKSFMIELHSYYDMVLFEENGLLNLIQNNSTNNVKAYWIQAPFLLSKVTEFSRGKGDQIYKDVYNLLSPMTTSPIKIRKAVTIMNKEIKYIEDKYNLPSNKKTSKVVKKNQSKPKNKFTIRHSSNKIIKNKKMLNKTSFIKNIKNGKLKKSELIKRGNVEVNKFFNTQPVTSNLKFESLDNDEKIALSDITENLTYFTPQSIKIGSQEKDLSGNNIDKFNLDFFDKIVDAKIKNSLQFSTPKTNVANLISLQVVDDPNVKDYLGDDTLFVSENLQATEQFKRLKAFNNSFAKNLSINKKNKLNTAKFDPDSNKFSLKKYNKVDKKSKLKNLPLSIKSILLGNNETITKFPIRNGLFDPLKSPETSEATKQNFTRIKKLEYLSGYSFKGGFPILNKPKWVKFDKSSINYSKKILCRMIDYEDEDFDITVDNNEIPSVDDVFTLED